MLKNRYEWYVLAIIILSITVFVHFNYYKPPNLEVSIVQETPLLKYPRYMGKRNLSKNRVLQTLLPGQKYRVEYIRHDKSHMFYRIKTEDENAGYVMYGGDIQVKKLSK